LFHFQHLAQPKPARGWELKNFRGYLVSVELAIREREVQPVRGVLGGAAGNPTKLGLLGERATSGFNKFLECVISFHFHFPFVFHVYRDTNLVKPIIREYAAQVAADAELLFAVVGIGQFQAVPFLHITHAVIFIPSGFAYHIRLERVHAVESKTRKHFQKLFAVVHFHASNLSQSIQLARLIPLHFWL
jgi:hypothetical protein